MTQPSFPNESSEYRSARQALLNEEIELRARVEKVAALRRQLPKGGALKEDYVFEEMVDGASASTRFSDLFFSQSNTLMIYSFMYSPAMDHACPMCVSFLNALDGQLPALEPNLSVAVVARHEAAELDKFARDAGWKNLRLVSSQNNDFNPDYFAEIDGSQFPMAHVFVKDGDTISHSWSSEMFFADTMENTHPRHLDMMWPRWNIQDLTPAGRTF